MPHTLSYMTVFYKVVFRVVYLFAVFYKATYKHVFICCKFVNL
jgi:hypothetical protein